MMLARIRLFIVVLIALCSLSGFADETVFSGTPAIRVTVLAADDPLREELGADKGVEFAVQIVESGGRYYWATRQMKEMRAHESVGYVTYVAEDGSGYVRVSRGFGKGISDGPYDYLEHLNIGLNTISYLGYNSP